VGDLDAVVDGARDDDSLYEAACGEFRRRVALRAKADAEAKTAGFRCNWRPFA